MFKKIAIIGVGLIGGSIGLAAKKKKLAKQITGVCRHESSLEKALKLRAIDRVTLDVNEAVKDADLIILATPVGTFKELVNKISKSAKTGAILIDVGSTKEEVIRTIEKVLPKRVSFVGVHPMAGSEKSGVGFAKPDLFEHSTCVICKTKSTHKNSLNKVAKFWKALGAEVVVISPEEHDMEVAQISHLPHAVATALVGSVDAKSLRLASSGFRDTTRIAGGEPVVWADIFLSNKKEILKSIDRFEKVLNSIRGLVKKQDYKGLIKEFGKNKKIRDAITKK